MDTVGQLTDREKAGRNVLTITCISLSRFSLETFSDSLAILDELLNIRIVSDLAQQPWQCLSQDECFLQLGLV